MPYPESCPECGGAFRNTGTHYTARRNEVGRHVLLELGCQNTTRRYWWDFTTGIAAEDGATPGRRASLSASATEVSNGSVHAETNGHAHLATLEPPTPPFEPPTPPTPNGHDDVEDNPTQQPDIAALPAHPMDTLASLTFEMPQPESRPLEPATSASGSPALKDAFVRQLQLDRLTLRQMRSWLMSDEARRAIEVAAGATEATYERLALILFGVDLPQLLGKQAAPPPNPGMSAEERLELQREKARIRARVRRAAAKAAREQPDA
jgi:hypothetical protein